MLRPITAGATSQSVPVFLQDSSSTTGAGLAALVYNTASLTCYYKRSDGTASVAVTLADATLGTWTSSGFKQIDSTHMPGSYEFGIPNAAVAAGATWVEFFFMGASNLAHTPVLIHLTPSIDGYTLEEATRLNLAALVGKLSGAAGTTVTIRDTADSKDRIVATVDASGNRTALTLVAT